MTSEPPAFSLAMPAYNEADSIEQVLRSTVGSLERLGRSWELIVIDNCSSDATPRIVSALAGDDARIRLVRHDENRLYSGSCATALREARGGIVGIIDSDGQFSADDLSAMIVRLEQGANLVMGWRQHRQDSLARRAMSLVFNTLGKIWIGFDLHDLNAGIRVFDRRFVDVATIRHRINMVNPELYVCAIAAGLTVAEVPVSHADREGGETTHDLARFWRIFVEVNRYFRELRGELNRGPRVAAEHPSR